MKYAVLIGNPIDGMLVYGPFGSVEDSVEWANANVDDTWVVTIINDPTAAQQTKQPQT